MPDRPETHGWNELGDRDRDDDLCLDPHCSMVCSIVLSLSDMAKINLCFPQLDLLSKRILLFRTNSS